VIKATIALVLAQLVVPRLRHRSAAERHLLWVVTLIAAAALPLLGAVLPAWQPEWARHVTVNLPASIPYLERWSGTAGGDVIVRATGLEPRSLASRAALAVWGTGTLIAVLLLVAQLRRLRLIASSSQNITDLRLCRLSEEARLAIGLRVRPTLLQSARVAIPFTWGLRPRVLLPASALTWSDQRIRAVLLHEMAHVRRHDWAVHMLAEGVCAVYWFHPLVWLARRQLRSEGERAADDVVLGLGIDAGDYAAYLVDVIRQARLAAPMSTVAMARSSELAIRMASLLGFARNRCAVSRAKVGAAVVLTSLAAVPLGAIATPGVAARIEVRTVRLPAALNATAASPPGTFQTAVRSIRVTAPYSGPAGVIPPEIVEYTTPPLYSDEARQRGIEGIVVAHATVSPDGRVEQARVIRGLGYGLDQNALVALRQWRFRAGSRNGVALSVNALVDIEFSLRQETLNELIANDMATQVGPGVTPPRAVLIVQPPPTPSGASTVVLDVVLLEDGRPKIVRILQSMNPELDETAVRTFEQWRFTPALKDGVPVKVRITAQVNFHD